MKIGDFELHNDNVSETFIIAELSANHNQKQQNAVATIKVAKKAGANAVKLQTYTPDNMTINCKKKISN